MSAKAGELGENNPKERSFSSHPPSYEAHPWQPQGIKVGAGLEATAEVPSPGLVIPRTGPAHSSEHGYNAGSGVRDGQMKGQAQKIHLKKA